MTIYEDSPLCRVHPRSHWKSLTVNESRPALGSTSGTVLRAHTPAGKGLLSFCELALISYPSFLEPQDSAHIVELYVLIVNKPRNVGSSSQKDTQPAAITENSALTFDPTSLTRTVSGFFPLELLNHTHLDSFKNQRHYTSVRAWPSGLGLTRRWRREMYSVTGTLLESSGPARPIQPLSEETLGIGASDNGRPVHEARSFTC